MYEYQYLVGGVLSICVSMHILIKRPRTLALKSLSAFGFVVSLWEFSDYIAERAPDAITAASYFRIVILTSHLGFPLYLLTVLAIRHEIDKKIILLISTPAIVQTAAIFYHYFDSYEFFLAEFGWSYRVVGFQLPLVISGVIFVSYLVAIFAVLLSLTKKATLPMLKRKYAILLISFACFQAIGTTLTNALLAFDVIDPVFRLGGILQFLTFLSIWYALSLREKGIPLSIMGENFSEVYSSFLTVFYNSMVSSQLGEEYLKFTDFVRKSKINGQVSLDRSEITFKEREGLDLAELITRNLEIFENDRIGHGVTDHYLRVLKVAEQKLGGRFDEFVEVNEDFLKASDLIYGVSGGRFLERMTTDASLPELDDIDSCLRIYKRILMTIISDAPAKTKDLRNILSRHAISKAIDISEYGEVSIEKVRERVLQFPNDERLSVVIDRFNSVISEVIEDIIAEPDADIDQTLGKLKHVLRLNRDKADALGVYPKLLGTLATKIPKAQIHRLYSDYLEELVEERTRELKKVQENLLKSQRLAAIGEAAAMVGHDLRNPLQAVVYSLYLAKKELESSPSDSLEGILETINEQLEYMNKIVSDLEYYAKPIKPKFAETNLHELLREVFSTVRVPDHVKVFIEIEEDFSSFVVDPLLMKRVLTNLITNALHAMEEEGRLRIGASRKGEDAFISVKDTGAGIREENLDKLFQPLFTTKAKGLGLGLAVCKRLVEALEGSITVETTAGKGTTFTVKVPFRSSDQSLPQETLPNLSSYQSVRNVASASQA
nr:ATP-binding protein [Candidatus Njordarchaeum guaymaensis]